MPWNIVQNAEVAAGEVFYMTTSVAASRSYVLFRETGGESDTLYWGEWKFGFYVDLNGGGPLRWVERNSKPCYGRRMNYFTAASGDVQAFAYYLPRKSFFDTVKFLLYRFD